MARDGLFFKPFGQVHSSSRVPVLCLLVQGAWASLLGLSGTFDQLTDCLLFASWIFYALVTSSVFVLRVRAPHIDRPYRTWGYPIVPMLFILVALWLIANTLYSNPRIVAGLVMMSIGFPPVPLL